MSVARPAPPAGALVERTDDIREVPDVQAHRALGRRRPAAADRLQDLAVLADDLRADDGPADARDERRLQHLEDPAREGDQQVVAGGARDQVVEARVGAVERIGAGRVPLGLVHRRLELADRALVCVARREAGERDLEEQPRLEQLRQRDALGGEHRGDRLADVAAHALVRRAGHEDAPARALAGADQVRARQQPQRLAQSRAADAELRRELLLGADAVPRLEALRLEVAADLQRHLLAGARAGRGEARVERVGLGLGGHAGVAMLVQPGQ
jgi:hypothetical protein